MPLTELPPPPNVIIGRERIEYAVTDDRSPFIRDFLFEGNNLETPETSFGYIEEGSADFMLRNAENFIDYIHSISGLSDFQLRKATFLTGFSIASIRKYPAKNIEFYIGDTESPKDIFCQVDFQIEGSNALFSIVSDLYSKTPNFNISYHNEETYKSQLCKGLYQLYQKLPLFINDLS